MANMKLVDPSCLVDKSEQTTVLGPLEESSHLVVADTRIWWLSRCAKVRMGRDLHYFFSFDPSSSMQSGRE